MHFLKKKEVKTLLKEYKSKAKISVDGGMNDLTKKQVVLYHKYNKKRFPYGKRFL